MGRRGHSTSIGKFAKIHHDQRVSEIRILGELLRREQRASGVAHRVWATGAPGATPSVEVSHRG